MVGCAPESVPKAALKLMATPLSAERLAAVTALLAELERKLAVTTDVEDGQMLEDDALSFNWSQLEIFSEPPAEPAPFAAMSAQDEGPPLHPHQLLVASTLPF